MHNLVLASKSPRRHFLLEKWGYPFSSLSIEISEILDENLNLGDQIESLAQEKAQALVDSGKLSKNNNFIVLSADTVVVLDKQVLGKPKDFDQAVDFLTKMSGRSHEVITAISLLDYDRDEYHLSHDITKVWFKDLSKDRVVKYVKTGDPMDKAGAYGIQGEGKNFIAKYVGSFENVMGLPMQLLEREIKRHGWEFATN